MLIINEIVLSFFKAEWICFLRKDNVSISIINLAKSLSLSTSLAAAQKVLRSCLKTILKLMVILFPLHKCSTMAVQRGFLSQ